MNVLPEKLHENLEYKLQEFHDRYLPLLEDRHKKSGWRTTLPAGIAYVPLRWARPADRLKPVLHLRRKAATAAAIACRVRVLKHKSLPHQRLFVLQDHAVQIQ